jgi:dephospho-CoA kinase
MIKKIGIIGQQCAGKTTIAKLIQEIYENNTVYVLKFAEPIYQSWAALHQDFKNRGFMQEFGDLAKKYCGIEVFARCFEQNVDEVISVQMNDNDVLLCDDIRYQFEVDTATKLGFKILAVEADKDIRKQRALAQGLDFIEGHNSETEIPTLISEADYVLINNDITTEHLRDNTKIILNRMFGMAE